MAQQFSSDAQMSDTGVALVAGNEVAVLSTVPMPVPFVTAKAKVHASVNVLGVAGTTSYDIFIRRNVNAENLLLDVVTFVFAGANKTSLSIDVIDQIPSPRDVTYQVSVRPAGGNATTQQQFIEATLLSG